MAFGIFKPKKYHLGMTGDEVKAALQGGGGGGGEWTPKFTLHVIGERFAETMAEIQAFNPKLGDRVAIEANGEIIEYCTVVSSVYSGTTLDSITVATDFEGPNIVKSASLNGTKLEYYFLDAELNQVLAPVSYTWNGATLSAADYADAIILSLSPL